MKRELDCLRDCNAACCSNVAFQVLTGEQFFYLQDHGVVFQLSPEGMGIVGPCAMLNGRKCRIYQDRKHRPGDCFDVKPGDPDCLIFRAREGYVDE